MKAVSPPRWPVLEIDLDGREGAHGTVISGRSNADKVSSLTEWGGANLEHRYALNYAEQRPTELNCTAVTGGFSISAGHGAMRTSLGVIHEGVAGSNPVVPTA